MSIVRDNQMFAFGDGLGEVAAEQSKISEFAEKMGQLLTLQSSVDKALAKMPAGKDKDRLLKERDENRGIVSKYVIPAYNTVKQYISSSGGALSGATDEAEDMGILPLLPIAAVMAATAALGYVGKSIYVEAKILNDPAMTSAQKTTILTSGGLSSVGSLIGNTKNLAIVGVLGFLAYMAYKKFGDK